MFFQEKAVILQPEVVFYVLNYFIYILQILNQEHPIQPGGDPSTFRYGCVYPSNLEIKNILYIIRRVLALDLVVYILQILKSRTSSYTTVQETEDTRDLLCISFKSWNQEHPIQPWCVKSYSSICCVYPSNLEIKNILYNRRSDDAARPAVVYILQILKSRTSYTTISLCQALRPRCVYPSNLEIKNILYNDTTDIICTALLCISFKSWNQEHPIQLRTPQQSLRASCVYPSNLEIKNILYNWLLGISWLSTHYTNV